MSKDVYAPPGRRLTRLTEMISIATLVNRLNAMETPGYISSTDSHARLIKHYLLGYHLWDYRTHERVNNYLSQVSTKDAWRSILRAWSSERVRAPHSVWIAAHYGLVNSTTFEEASNQFLQTLDKELKRLALAAYDISSEGIDTGDITKLKTRAVDNYWMTAILWAPGSQSFTTTKTLTEESTDMNYTIQTIAVIDGYVSQIWTTIPSGQSLIVWQSVSFQDMEDDNGDEITGSELSKQAARDKLTEVIKNQFV